MQQNKSAIYAFTATNEGGYSSDPRDAGNWTGGAVGNGTCIGSKYGISAPVLFRDNPSITATIVKNLPTAKFSLVADSYWKTVMGDLLPSGIDVMVFDYGYNVGPGKAVMLLQSLVGVKADGIIGKMTLAAVSKYITANTISSLIQALHDKQVADYKSMKDFAIYGRGWLARTDRRRDLAIKLTTPQSVPVA